MSTQLPPPASARLSWFAGLKLGLFAEFSLLRRPQVILAALAIIVVPSLYVLIYVSSVWDPYGNMTQLPAALVNADQAVQRSGRTIELGSRVVATLQETRPFNFEVYPTESDARAAVRDGKVFFALILPPDFTQRALSARVAAPAEFVIYLSEGGNYTASVMSKRFGSELAHTLNESINRERWSALVAARSAEASPSLASGLIELEAGAQRLATGSEQLRAGSAKLADGAEQAEKGALKLSDGAGQLAPAGEQISGGMKQVAEAVATIRKQLPSDQQMEELSAGSKQLREGAGQLNSGAGQLENGAVRLVAGSNELEKGARRVPIVGGKLGDGAGQLRQGLTTFKEGLDRLADGASRLSSGSERLDTGVQPLSAGVIRLNAGLATLQSRLPPDEKMDLFATSMRQLSDGSQQLAEGLVPLQKGASDLSAGSIELALGAKKLSDGLSLAHTRFAEEFGDALPQKLAAAVTAKIEVVAPVQNNGMAFAPYFSALSLWIGAVMMSFVFFLRRLIAPLQNAPRSARWLSKAAMLYGMGILQASVLYFMLVAVLRIPLVHPLQVWLAALVGSFAFVSVILLFLSVLGDGGRLLAVILLIFQLAASGGIYPIELSHSFYQRTHPYLPFTLLVRAFRATMFSAFEGNWGGIAGQLCGVAGFAILASILAARWKYIPTESYAAAVDL